MSRKIHMALFIVGIIAVATFSIYTPYLIEDSGWEKVKTPFSLKEGGNEGRVHLGVNPTKSINKTTGENNSD